jgi:hypothetical protein
MAGLNNRLPDAHIFRPTLWDAPPESGENEAMSNTPYYDRGNRIM